MYIVIYQLQSFLDVTVQLDVHVDVPAASSRDSSTSGGRVEALGCRTTFGRCVSHCSWENELRSLVDRVSTFIDFDIVGQGSILTFGFCLIYLGGWTTHSAFRDRSWLPVCFHTGSGA